MNTEQGITCHSWNGSKTQIVVANNSFILEIYAIRGETWDKLHTLKEHHQLVSAVDWHPITNRIISSSHDRNVVVWEFNEIWKPTLVNFYQTRGVLDASWSLRGDKFVVGTGSKNIGVGHWSESLGLWNTRRIKNFTSSVTCVRFDESGHVIAAGSTDGTCKVISTFMEELDASVPSNYRFSSVKSFGDTLYTLTTGAWVNSVSWSPDSNWLCVAAHNNSVFFTNISGSEQKKTWNSKPFMSVQFLNENKVVAGGFDYRNIVFEKSGENWGDAKEGQSVDDGKTGGIVQSRVKMMAKGFDGRKDRDTMATKHKNTITCIRKIDAERYSTSDITGSLYIWRI
ncbi:hypothetical protein SteCoe_31149 [Stentor coeruleus]|uniref:Arp2/3 complex 41 kDa subunit n=1 Tax=Stentor coeruleus TaxID=5963 RepID=A0A1R2B2E9_9CILI|nr:hypothetical protein SteCoe_31149 [Stentor coeruleus]